MATQVTLNSGAVSSAGSLKLQTNGTTDAVTIDTAQNLGLGVTPSSWALGKAFEVGFAGNALWGNATDSVFLTQNMYYDGNFRYKNTAAATNYQQTVGQHRWFTAGSGTAGNPITFTQAMTLDASGNLLVNRTSGYNSGTYQSQKVKVTGGIGINSDPADLTSRLTLLGDSSTGNGTIDWSSGFSLIFSGNGTERARIDSSGNLLVGTTSAFGKLYVSSTSTSLPVGRFEINAAGDTAQPAIYIVKTDNATTTSQVFQKFYVNGGTACGQINANGANTAAFGSTSDQRVKENIVDLPSQLANIMALRPVEFDYIESYGGGHQIGFIAQEVEQIYPDTVSEDSSEEKIKSITGWSKTEARLVKAIQEQQTLIQDQLALINSLTARVESLENK